MEASVDQDQKWLVECLTAALDTNSEIRSFAEASLKQASLQCNRKNQTTGALEWSFQDKLGRLQNKVDSLAQDKSILEGKLDYLQNGNDSLV